MTRKQRDYTRGANFIPAAQAALESARSPMTAAEIVARATVMGVLSSRGATPDRTMHAALSRRIAKHGDASGFRRVGKGTFELVEN